MRVVQRARPSSARNEPRSSAGYCTTTHDPLVRYSQKLCVKLSRVSLGGLLLRVKNSWPSRVAISVRRYLYRSRSLHFSLPKYSTCARFSLLPIIYERLFWMRRDQLSACVADLRACVSRGGAFFFCGAAGFRVRAAKIPRLPFRTTTADIRDWLASSLADPSPACFGVGLGRSRQRRVPSKPTATLRCLLRGQDLFQSLGIFALLGSRTWNRTILILVAGQFY